MESLENSLLAPEARGGTARLLAVDRFKRLDQVTALGKTGLAGPHHLIGLCHGGARGGVRYLQGKGKCLFSRHPHEQGANGIRDGKPHGLQRRRGVLFHLLVEPDVEHGRGSHGRHSLL